MTLFVKNVSTRKINQDEPVFFTDSTNGLDVVPIEEATSLTFSAGNTSQPLEKQQIGESKNDLRTI